MSAVLFGLAGAAAGTTEVMWLLAQTSRQRPHPLAFGARLFIVATVLLLAALNGHLLAGAVGWMVGFFVATLIAYWRLS